MKLKSYPCVYGLNVFLVLKFLCGNPNFYYDGWRRKWQPLQYSCLENPVDRGAWWAAGHGVAQSWTRLKRLSMHACIGEGNDNPLQYSCLGNLRDGGAWWAAVYGVTQSRTRLKRLSSRSSSIMMVMWKWVHWGGDNEIIEDGVHDRISTLIRRNQRVCTK